jgi:hypothetical protein
MQPPPQPILSTKSLSTALSQQQRQQQHASQSGSQQSSSRSNKLQPLDASQANSGRSTLSASASAPVLPGVGAVMAVGAHSGRSSASSTRSPSYSPPPAGMLVSPHSLRSSPRHVALEPLLDAPQLPLGAVGSDASLLLTASSPPSQSPPRRLVSAVRATAGEESKESVVVGGSNVAALLSANRALRTNADGTRGSHSIPGKYGPAASSIFVMEPAISTEKLRAANHRPADTTPGDGSDTSSSADVGSPLRGQALRDALRARAREEELRLSGAIHSDAGGAALAAVRAATSSPQQKSSLHSSFGAPFSIQIPRLLPPPHRPAPVKMLMQQGAHHAVGGHEYPTAQPPPFFQPQQHSQPTASASASTSKQKSAGKKSASSTAGKRA